MILFSCEGYEHISRHFRTNRGISSGEFTIGRYENQELHARVQKPVSGEHCLVLGSIAPPDSQLLSFALLGHTLKKEEASTVTAILPYLAYTRQDKDKAGESLGAAWIGSLLKASGFDQILTVDLHSERDKKLMAVPILSISPAAVFAETIKNYKLTDATIVAPDGGAIRRCEDVKDAAGMPSCETPFFEKKRTDTGIIHRGPIGDVSRRVIIIDDMLDTGGTLVSACEKLVEANAEEIYILVTHGLFTGTGWTKLWSLRVKRIFCTDTVPVPASINTETITILPVAPLLCETLARISKAQRNPEEVSDSASERHPDNFN